MKTTTSFAPRGTSGPRGSGGRRGSGARRLAAVLLAGAAGAALTLTATAGPAAAAGGPVDGSTFTVAGVGSGKLLDVTGGSTAENAPVIQYTATGGTNQQWVTRTGTGSGFTLVNVRSGKCLAVSGSSSTAGAAVVQATCANGATGQSWLFSTTSAGVNTISNAHSTLCLDVTAKSTADSAVIEQWTCNGGTNQQWRLAAPMSTPPTSAPPTTPPGTTTHRVGVWGAGVNPGGIKLSNQTVREIVHTSAGGTAPQLRVSNLFGSGTLTVGHVDVALQSSGGTAKAGSHHAVTFGGSGSLTLAAGQERVSDSIDLTLAANQNLLVSLYVSNTITSSTWHSGATATTWISSAGNHSTDDATTSYPTTTTSWYLLSSLTATSSTATGTLVTFGDSITDGYGSSNNGNERYPDYLARRLVAAAGGPKLGVVNAGIGGNRVLTDAGNSYGYSALHRFSRDALGQPAVRDVILLEGVNDLRGTSVTGQSIIDADKTLISQAHAAGVAIYGGTILPFGGATSWTATQDSQRQTINTWIRTSGSFDGVVDFDAAVRDPAATTQLLASYDHGDHLHPNNAGYQAMANTVNLAMLKS